MPQTSLFLYFSMRCNWILRILRLFQPFIFANLNRTKYNSTYVQFYKYKYHFISYSFCYISLYFGTSRSQETKEPNTDGRQFLERSCLDNSRVPRKYVLLREQYRVTLHPSSTFQRGNSPPYRAYSTQYSFTSPDTRRCSKNPNDKLMEYRPPWNND